MELPPGMRRHDGSLPPLRQQSTVFVCELIVCEQFQSHRCCSRTILRQPDGGLGKFLHTPVTYVPVRRLTGLGCQPPQCRLPAPAPVAATVRRSRSLGDCRVSVQTCVPSQASGAGSEPRRAVPHRGVEPCTRFSGTRLTDVLHRRDRRSVAPTRSVGPPVGGAVQCSMGNASRHVASRWSGCRWPAPNHSRASGPQRRRGRGVFPRPVRLRLAPRDRRLSRPGAGRRRTASLGHHRPGLTLTRAPGPTADLLGAESFLAVRRAAGSRSQTSTRCSPNCNLGGALRRLAHRRECDGLRLEGPRVVEVVRWWARSDAGAVGPDPAGAVAVAEPCRDDDAVGVLG
jgi:hypothetical protein